PAPTRGCLGSDGWGKSCDSQQRSCRPGVSRFCREGTPTDLDWESTDESNATIAGRGGGAAAAAGRRGTVDEKGKSKELVERPRTLPGDREGLVPASPRRCGGVRRRGLGHHATADRRGLRARSTNHPIANGSNICATCRHPVNGKPTPSISCDSPGR